MNIKQVKETCFYSTDLESIKRFYHDKLGLPIIHFEKDKHIFFRAGDSVLLCFNPNDSKLKTSPPAHFAVGKIHFALEVPTHLYNETKKELVDKWIVLTDEVTWPSGKKSFYFNDPAQNVVEIVPDLGIWD